MSTHINETNEVENLKKGTVSIQLDPTEKILPKNPPTDIFTAIREGRNLKKTNYDPEKKSKPEETGIEDALKKVLVKMRSKVKLSTASEHEYDTDEFDAESLKEVFSENEPELENESDTDNWKSESPPISPSSKDV